MTPPRPATAKAIIAEEAGSAAGAAETSESVWADSVVIEQTITLAKKASPMKDAEIFTGTRF